MNDKIKSRRLSAIMFTDIVDYSRLMGRDESAAMTLLENKEEIVSPIIKEFDGKTLKKSGPRVIKELGVDPKTKTAIEIKDGRYGAYVSNGKINATLPNATSTDDITLEIAIQLIADKKAKGPVRKKNFRRKN